MVHVRKASRRASAAARRWARADAAEGVGRPPAPQELRRALAGAHLVRTASLSGEMQPAMQSMLLGRLAESSAGSASGGGRRGTGIGAEDGGAMPASVRRNRSAEGNDEGATERGYLTGETDAREAEDLHSKPRMTWNDSAAPPGAVEPVHAAAVDVVAADNPQVEGEDVALVI